MDNTEERTPEMQINILKFKDDPLIYFSSDMKEKEVIAFLLLATGRLLNDFLNKTPDVNL